MATVINNPATAPAPVERDNGMGFLLGVIAIIVFAVLFFMYVVPYITSSFQGPQINVPGKVDVNVHTPTK